MNLLDLGIIVLLVLAAINGYRRGAALQLSTYAGLLAGLLAGALVAPIAAGLASSPFAQAAIALGVLLGLAAMGDALGWAVGTRVWAAAHRSVLGAVDSVAGSFVAAVALLVAVWFLTWNLANGPFPSVSSEIQGSAIVRGLDRTLPRPPGLLAEVRQFLNRFGFPEVFAGLPQAPAAPVAEPSDPEVRAIFDLADQSTVRIVGEACGAVQEGSGFIVAADYVVTNAHVVAGVGSPRVQEQGGGSQGAVVVAFDPRLDIAVLHTTSNLDPRPLPLDGKVVDRGTQGAVMGYPEGGPLKGRPGAVRQEIEAVGRDIYGRSVVRRDVYELQAVVRPGNSGGPFVLSDGTVAGVVFAASTSDSDIGYALTTPQIIPLVRQGEGSTTAVSTQGCAR